MTSAFSPHPEILREGNGRCQECQLNCGDRIRFLKRGQIGAEAVLERLEENGRQRHEQEEP